MVPQKTNSSFGNWAVMVSSNQIKFFWKKSEAEKFISNNKEYFEDMESAKNDPALKNKSIPFSII